MKEEKIITIFGSKFVKHNKNKCKMIINNKIYLLTDKYEISNDNKRILKIKLLMLNDAKINLSYMFYKCDCLIKFNLMFQNEEKSIENYNDKNDQIENININNSYDS